MQLSETHRTGSLANPAPGGREIDQGAKSQAKRVLNLNFSSRHKSIAARLDPVNPFSADCPREVVGLAVRSRATSYQSAPGINPASSVAQSGSSISTVIMRLCCVLAS